MGHAVNPDREYRLLQKRLDGTVTGAPDSPVLQKILRMLFSASDAELARKLPGEPTRLEKIAREMDVPPDKLKDRLSDMARRGLVFDFEHDGQSYFAMAPMVLGFFEFTFMRTRDELPIAELAKLFDEYMDEDDRFGRSVFQGRTQIGRALVREEALPEGDHSEVLDWERATHLVRSATAVGVSMCACRHKASHVGRACDRPMEVCLSLNFAAESLIRNGIARQVSADEAVDILQRSKEAGLAQIGDNVQRKPTYICNCCGCCCEMMHAVRELGIKNAIVTSNWIMQVDVEQCVGCGACVSACPVEAISLAELDGGEKPKKRAVVDAELCLGCGVCKSTCRFSAIEMKPRPQRVITPETVFDRVVSMAIERGKLAELVFDDPSRLSHRALGRIIGAVERSPLVKAALAIKPLRSAFLRQLVKEGRRRAGSFREALE